jgi:hypothetical protein|tara:strand:- start:196 stop:336 length:141 start_codon:yes stop_codon:yes gene_type:complete
VVANAHGSLCQTRLLQLLSRAMHDRKAFGWDSLCGAVPYGRELLLK